MCPYARILVLAFCVLSSSSVPIDDQLTSDDNIVADTETSEFSSAERRFQNEMLEAHNNYRARHCAPPLTLDDNISRSAQAYANELAHTTQTVQSMSRNDLGQNLYMMSGSGEPIVNGATTTQAWYDGIKYYNYGRPSFSKSTGSFTQIVWKGSTRLGVGFAFGDGGHTVYVVAQYGPAGNMQGAFSANVAPSKCSDTIY